MWKPFSRAEVKDQRLALALLLGTVGIAQATGWWLVSGREMVNLE